MVYCVGKTVEWLGYFVLCVLLSFLLSLHCIMYKKINKRWSFRVFKRNRVQVLTFSVMLTGSLFIKEMFFLDYFNLVILLLGQLLRFLIWSFTLRNFLKSGMDLMIKSHAVKVIRKVLLVSMVGGTCFIVGYAIYLIIMESVYKKSVLSMMIR